MELSGAALWPTWRGWIFCSARAHPFWIKRGVCPLHDLWSRYGNAKTRNPRKNICKCECGTRVRQRERNSHFTDPFSPPFPSAMELLGAALWPTWRGWTFYPAQAHPFWMKRGVCQLHDLVSRLGSKDKKDKKNQKKHLQVRVRYPSAKA
jgi:hypothetical protein